MTQTYFNYIDGEWVQALSGEVYPSINPANADTILGYFQKSDQRDVEIAIEIAEKAFKTWSKIAVPERGKCYLNSLIY